MVFNFNPIKYCVNCKNWIVVKYKNFYSAEWPFHYITMDEGALKKNLHHSADAYHISGNHFFAFFWWSLHSVKVLSELQNFDLIMASKHTEFWSGLQLF